MVEFLTPTDMTARLGRYLKAGDLTRAFKFADWCVDNDIKDEPVVKKIAEVYFAGAKKQIEAGDLAAAEKTIEKGLEITPKNTHLHRAQVVLFIKQDRLVEAETLIQRILADEDIAKTDWDITEFKKKRAYVQKQLGKTDAAQATQTESLEFQIAAAIQKGKFKKAADLNVHLTTDPIQQTRFAAQISFLDDAPQKAKKLLLGLVKSNSTTLQDLGLLLACVGLKSVLAKNICAALGTVSAEQALSIRRDFIEHPHRRNTKYSGDLSSSQTFQDLGGAPIQQRALQGVVDIPRGGVSTVMQGFNPPNNRGPRKK